jgi:nicotinate-nucleotide--dimethylbenzimidazole phosphoribosyltransferase
LSKVVTIAKLEALLSRIRTRAAEPRSARPAAATAPAPVAPAPVALAPVAVVAAPAAPAPVAAPAPAPVAVVAPPPAAVASPAFVPPPARAVPAAPAPSPEPPEAPEETTLPPPPLVEVTSEADFDVDVDVSMTTPEPLTASDAPELQAGEAEASELEAPLRDSRERLAAASPVAPAPAARDDGPTVERVEVLSDEEGVAAEDEEEGVEEAPASSRRPVAPPPEERLAELAFGTEEPQPARHTPPPKSGRLPAPPAGEFDPDVTGVRAATPGLSLEEEAPASAPPAEPSVLSAQAVRADLASGANVRVPDVLGEAQAFAPATFLALLDASLAL